ncbi:MAG: flagellar motor switch protein FliG [Desulfobulbaceae bacterium]|uniref:Flagellar motor switch protein FliG n=1 Tax=Candidatus Desulfatifera sulfidica TaxID=2841691 RepID=A0A8J6TBD4_9BACT|nr:flagellar motor switch protein FliG [Candidatus Desulfatifera sulfidica]
MSAPPLTGPNKAAILLLSLSEEEAAKVLKELSDDEIRQVTRIMASIDYIPEETQNRVLQNFVESRQKFSGLLVKGDAFTKNAITATNEGERTDRLLEQFIFGTESRPLESIALMPPRMVADLLSNEHPQTVALVLATQEVQHAGEVILNLPESIRSDVMYRIAKIEKISPEVITRIEDALYREIGLVVAKEQKQVGGIDKVVDLLGTMKNNLDQNILDAMDVVDPDLVEEIRKKLFTFENLIELDTRSLQTILRDIDNDTLTKALKTASEEVRAKIFANISNRAAAMIQDDLEVIGLIRLSEVASHQHKIIKAALRLEAEGKISLGGGGDNLV